MRSASARRACASTRRRSATSTASTRAARSVTARTTCTKTRCWPTVAGATELVHPTGHRRPVGGEGHADAGEAHRAAPATEGGPDEDGQHGVEHRVVPAAARGPPRGPWRGRAYADGLGHRDDRLVGGAPRPGQDRGRHDQDAERVPEPPVAGHRPPVGCIAEQHRGRGPDRGADHRSEHGRAHEEPDEPLAQRMTPPARSTSRTRVAPTSGSSGVGQREAHRLAQRLAVGDVHHQLGETDDQQPSRPRPRRGQQEHAHRQPGRREEGGAGFGGVQEPERQEGTEGVEAADDAGQEHLHQHRGASDALSSTAPTRASGGRTPPRRRGRSARMRRPRWRSWP